MTDEGTWEERRAGEVAIGSACHRCGRMARLFPPGHPVLCPSCASLDEDEDDEVSSPRYVRCPKCKHQSDVCEGDISGVYEEGPHSLYCDECGFEFEFTTEVSYSFESPPLLPRCGGCGVQIVEEFASKGDLCEECREQAAGSEDGDADDDGKAEDEED